VHFVVNHFFSHQGSKHTKTTSVLLAPLREVPVSFGCLTAKRGCPYFALILLSEFVCLFRSPNP